MGGNGAIAQSYPNQAHVCTPGPRLNLRETPAGRVLTILNNQTTLERVAPPAGNWQPVATPNYRGYVWSGYVCDGEANAPVAQQPARTARFQPAMCPDVSLARNVVTPDGLNVYRSNNPNSEIVRFLNEGAGGGRLFSGVLTPPPMKPVISGCPLNSRRWGIFGSAVTGWLIKLATARASTPKTNPP